MTKQFLDDAASRTLGVLASRPDASDAFLAEEFAGDGDAAETIARARTRFAVGAAHW